MGHLSFHRHPPIYRGSTVLVRPRSCFCCRSNRFDSLSKTASPGHVWQGSKANRSAISHYSACRLECPQRTQKPCKPPTYSWSSGRKFKCTDLAANTARQLTTVHLRILADSRCDDMIFKLVAMYSIHRRALPCQRSSLWTFLAHHVTFFTFSKYVSATQPSAKGTLCSV